MTIQERLFALRDEGYRAFQCRLMPSVEPRRVIGVRTPAVRALAKELSSSDEAADFLAALPHEYYEENNLHAFFVERIKNYPACVAALDVFLPYVDNWATCDMMRPKVFSRCRAELINDIRRWIASGATYTVRFGIEMLMTFFLDDGFKSEYLDLAASVRSEEYYVNMMTAWFFATALAKQYDATLPYIENRRLAPWTHNKAIRKAIESYRVTDEQKTYLRTLKAVE